jgi:hypothetical protein
MIQCSPHGAGACGRALDRERLLEEEYPDKEFGSFRAELAETVATTPEGLLALTGFVRKMTLKLGGFYFTAEEGEQIAFAISLDASVRRIFGVDQDAT